MLNLINNAVVVSNAYISLSEKAFPEESQAVFGELYQEGYSSSVKRLQNFSQRCEWQNEGRDYLKN